MIVHKDVTELKNEFCLKSMPIEYVIYGEDTKIDFDPANVSKIYAYSGSYAINYAIENKIPYELLSCEVHNYREYTTTTKAGFGKEGEQEATCSVCQQKVTRPIAAAVVPVINAQTFNNKNKTPKVTVVDADDNPVAAKVTFANKTRKAVGKYKVTVKLTGEDYEGSKTVTFRINPKGVSISKLTKGRKAFTVKWAKPSSTYRKQMTGYQIKYSTSSKMSNAKIVTVKSTKATSKKISKLKAKKTYYVQLRTYKTVKGVKYYSSWSKAKSVTTK